MKKAFLVVLVVLLVAAMGCTVTMTNPQALARAEKKKSEAETVERIRQYKILKEEQQLVTDILKIRYEAAVIKTKLNPGLQLPQPVSDASVKE